jgi:hypothetical protein
LWLAVAVQGFTSVDVVKDDVILVDLERDCADDFVRILVLV